MKIVISESQYLKILKEETAGLDYFIDFLVDTYPNVEKFKDVVRKFIIDSGCQNIEIKSIKHGASGLALHDKVVYNPSVFTSDLNYAMYVVFHEIAHQYQYKKYGEQKMYQLYTGELPINDAVEFLRNTENVADQFAIRKCRELHKLGLLDRTGLVKHGFYNRIPDMTLKTMLVKFRNIIRTHKVKDPIRVSEILYNSIVNGVNNTEQNIDESIIENGKRCHCSKCGWTWDLLGAGDDPYTCHKCGNENNQVEIEKTDIDERSRSFAFTRKRRLYSEPEVKNSTGRYKPEEREKKGAKLK
jgi:hypothetical protein